MSLVAWSISSILSSLFSASLPSSPGRLQTNVKRTTQASLITTLRGFELSNNYGSIWYSSVFRSGSTVSIFWHFLVIGWRVLMYTSSILTMGLKSLRLLFSILQALLQVSFLEHLLVQWQIFGEEGSLVCKCSQRRLKDIPYLGTWRLHSQSSMQLLPWPNLFQISIGSFWVAYWEEFLHPYSFRPLSLGMFMSTVNDMDFHLSGLGQHSL